MGKKGEEEIPMPLFCSIRPINKAPSVHPVQASLELFIRAELVSIQK